MKNNELKQFVKKRSVVKDFWLRVLAVFCCLVIVGLFAYVVAKVPMLGLLGFAVMLVVLVLGFYLFARIKFEYEYTYDNKGVLSIDKVRGASRNKTLVSVNVKDILEFGGYKESYKDSTNHDIFLDLTSEDKTKDEYYAVYRNENGQRVMFIFNPDERFLDVIERLYKRQY